MSIGDKDRHVVRKRVGEPVNLMPGRDPQLRPQPRGWRYSVTLLIFSVCYLALVSWLLYTGWSILRQMLK